MRHARRTLRRAIRSAAVGGLLCGALMVSDAMAGEPGGSDAAVPRAPGEVVADTMRRLGPARTAGGWTGRDGRPVVAVTDQEAAAEVRRAGARAEVKRHSLRELRAAAEALGRAPRITGTAWSLDYAANQVTVYADRTVSAADWDRMSDTARRAGEAVRMRRTAGEFTLRLDGGAPMLGRTGRCSAGFNVTDGRDNFVLTAGHCGAVGTPWFRAVRGTGRPLGTTVAGTFPGADFALVRYEDPAAFDGTNAVEVGQGRTVAVVGAADPVVGQRVFRSGSTTGLRNGRVTALGATVNYREGTVTGLIQTTVCAESGDSGGPLLAQGVALGITSGGNGDCAQGGVTFFQPVTSALSRLGVRIIDGRLPPGTPPSTSPAPTSSPTAVPSRDPSAPAGGGTGGGAAAGAPPEAGPARPAVTSIVQTPLLLTGLVVIGVSLIGLGAVRWLLTERADRDELRTSYAQSWG
ncbi:S1 family peptidase [Streptomyces lichenis]|uniref:S1 family peptidase n=1 Tax=Streptomyces lichenis TaxID=2306967 RepID=A0ABT0I8N6_9ACTN|nr:S1 family peptidase [Streptomyces lichenis]MCK8677664.1 S1 family peptidase [Streptomyces lichenis]